MSDEINSLTPLAVTVSRPERLFPTLTPEQVARMASHGRRRSTMAGDVLVEAGDTLIVSLQAGQFSGEANTISGRRALPRLRVTKAGAIHCFNST